MKPKKIKKLKGILCRSIGGEYFFRTRNSRGIEVDYAIAHNDLQIEINDGDAYIYNHKGEMVIDHGPKTLGIKK